MLYQKVNSTVIDNSNYTIAYKSIHAVHSINAVLYFCAPFSFQPTLCFVPTSTPGHPQYVDFTMRDFTVLCFCA